MPDLQHAASGDAAAERWHSAAVAADLTHHLFDGVPLYQRRFVEVQKFHDPGLAPVRDATGAYHIRPDGESAYSQRFVQTWGYYDRRASVQAADGWLHILPDGAPLSPSRYGWCGNFQDGHCAVRHLDGRYSHIQLDGSIAYEIRHLYAGDFRDGLAVVRYTDDGLCGHIHSSGSPAHPHRFLDLDVYHKGYARARDDQGWFHIDRHGRPAYPDRFASVEPFYNGQSLTETISGERVVILASAERAHHVWATSSAASCRRILIVGNIGAGKTTVAQRLGDWLGWPTVTIDDARRLCGDGSARGEAAAWSRFVQLATAPTNMVIEFSGSGPLAPLLHQHFRASGDQILVLWIHASPETCKRRVAQRSATVPYPDYGVSINDGIVELDSRLEHELASNNAWRGYPVQTISGERPRDVVIAQALAAARSWTGDLEE